MVASNSIVIIHGIIYIKYIFFGFNRDNLVKLSCPIGDTKLPENTKLNIAILRRSTRNAKFEKVK